MKTTTKTTLGYELITEFNHYSDCKDSTTTLKLMDERSQNPLCYAILSHAEQTLRFKVEHDNYLEVPMNEESPIESLESIAKQAQAIEEFSLSLANTKKDLFNRLAEYHYQALKSVCAQNKLAEARRLEKLTGLFDHHPKLSETEKKLLISDLERGEGISFFVVYKHSIKARQVYLRKIKSESGNEYIQNGKRKISKLNAHALVLGARESGKQVN